MRPTIKWLLICLSLIAISRFCHTQTDGFQVAKIATATDQDNPILLTDDQKAILSQRYYYLSKGAQSYVFVSEDGQFVLKFLRQPRLALLKLWHGWPLPFRSLIANKIEKKEQEMAKDIQSTQIAYQNLKEETGLLFIHLAASNDRLRIKIVDKLHIEHALNAGSVAFIVQKKAMTAKQQLEKWLQYQQIKEARDGLKQLLNLIKSRREKKIIDLDPNLIKNFGFVEGRAIQIDTGRFFNDDTLKSKEASALNRSKEDLIHLLNKYSLELSSDFEIAYEQLLNEPSF